MSGIVSRPYHPTACCEACVFGRGGHAEWCEKAISDSPPTLWLSLGKDGMRLEGRAEGLIGIETSERSES